MATLSFHKKNTHTFLMKAKKIDTNIESTKIFGCQDTHFPVRAHQPQQGPRECLGYKHPGPVEKHQVRGRSVGSQQGQGNRAISEAVSPPTPPRAWRYSVRGSSRPIGGNLYKKMLVIPSLPWQVPACNFSKRVFQRHLACNYPTQIKTKKYKKHIQGDYATNKL